MNARTTRRARLASLTSAALLALTLGVGGQFLNVGSASAAGADDTARLPRVVLTRPQLEISGTVSAVGNGTVTVNGKTVAIAGAELTGQLVVGATIKLHALVAADGSLRAREVRVVARPVARVAAVAPAAPAAPAADDKGQDSATHDATDDKGQDGAAHDATDDKGQDGAAHDATDDKGTDGATHDATDDKGTDGVTHDATDDKGTDGATHKADDKGHSDGSSHGGKDDKGKHK